MVLMLKALFVEGGEGRPGGRAAQASGGRKKAVGEEVAGIQASGGRLRTCSRKVRNRSSTSKHAALRVFSIPESAACLPLTIAVIVQNQVRPDGPSVIL